MKSGFIDQEVLRGDAYATTGRLETRRHFWQLYGTQPLSLEDWILETLHEVAPALWGRSIGYLDVGCGSGELAMRIALELPQASRAHGIDLAPGMIDHCRDRASQRGISIAFDVGDVQSLPFKEGAFDLLTAIHMLYHVPDMDRGVSELRRVLSPKGVALITTAAFDLEHGLNRLHYAALAQCDFPTFMHDRDTYSRFRPSAASAILERQFSSGVKTIEYENSARCADVDAVMKYYRSAMKFRHAEGPADPRIPPDLWERLDETVAAAVAEEIREQGTFVVPGRVFAFVVGEVT